jgi:plasmid stability protein
MGQVIIRNIDDDVLAVLRRRAAERKQSLEQTMREILRDAARPSRADIIAEMNRIRARTPKPLKTDSAKLIREARDR